MSDFLDGALQVLETAAPEVASLVGGPLAGQGVRLIEQTLGLQPTGDAKAAADAVLAASPDKLIELKEAGFALTAKLADAGIQLEQVDEQDRASARAREMAVHDPVPGALAFAVTLGFFGLLALLAFHELPPGAVTVLTAMTGSLGTAWIAIISYYFGSSSGHARATELLAQSTPPQS